MTLSTQADLASVPNSTNCSYQGLQGVLVAAARDTAQCSSYLTSWEPQALLGSPSPGKYPPFLASCLLSPGSSSCSSSFSAHSLLAFLRSSDFAPLTICSQHSSPIDPFKTSYIMSLLCSKASGGSFLRVKAPISPSTQ